MWETILPILGQVAMAMLSGNKSNNEDKSSYSDSALSNLPQGANSLMDNQQPPQTPQIIPFQPKSTSEILASLMNKRGF